MLTSLTEAQDFASTRSHGYGYDSCARCCLRQSRAARSHSLVLTWSPNPGQRSESLQEVAERYSWVTNTPDQALAEATDRGGNLSERVFSKPSLGFIIWRVLFVSTPERSCDVRWQSCAQLFLPSPSRVSRPHGSPHTVTLRPRWACGRVPVF